MKRFTRVTFLALVAWFTFTSMTTLNACNSRVNNAAIKTSSSDGQAAQAATVTDGEVVLGAARTSEYVPLLQGKRVALLSNQTGMVGDKHTLDLMLENGVNVVTM